MVWARNSISSKILASGQKVTVVPVRPAWGRTGHLQLGAGLAAVGELHAVVLAVAVDLDDQPGGQGVDDRHADAVQAARHLVAAAAELAAAVQLGQGDLDAGQLLLGIDVRRDPPAVVDDSAAAVGEQGDVDAGAEPGHGLVHRVVHDLPHQVVQAVGTGRADVHPGPLADRLQALQDGHVPGAVAAGTGGLLSVVDPQCFRSQRRASVLVEAATSFRGVS